MPRSPIAYFIVFATHGRRLQGREVLPDDKHQEQPAYVLDVPRRRIVRDTIREVCDYREWWLWAVHVRPDHVRVVVSADVRPERVIRDFKAYCGRRLKKKLREPLKLQRWALNGSGFVVFEKDEFEEEVKYTLHSHPDPMERYEWTQEPEL